MNISKQIAFFINLLLVDGYAGTYSFQPDSYLGYVRSFDALIIIKTMEIKEYVFMKDKEKCKLIGKWVNGNWCKNWPKFSRVT